MSHLKKKKLMKDDGIHRFLVRGGFVKKDAPGRLYVKDVTGKLQKLVKFRGKDYILFGLEQLHFIRSCFTK